MDDFRRQHWWHIHLEHVFLPWQSSCSHAGASSDLNTQQVLSAHPYCQWWTTIMCIVHVYYSSSSVIGTKANFRKHFPQHLLPDGQSQGLTWCLHCPLQSCFIETFVPACSRSGCRVRNFFQTELIFNVLSYLVPMMASPINCLISLPLNSPPLPTWLTSVCKVTTSIRTYGFSGAGPCFIGLSPALSARGLRYSLVG